MKTVKTVNTRPAPGLPHEVRAIKEALHHPRFSGEVRQFLMR